MPLTRLRRSGQSAKGALCRACRIRSASAGPTPGSDSSWAWLAVLRSRSCGGWARLLTLNVSASSSSARLLAMLRAHHVGVGAIALEQLAVRARLHQLAVAQHVDG